MLVPRRILPLSLAVLLLPAVASAQGPAPVSEADRATARQLAMDGKTALDRRDYTVAADRFTRAEALVHAPTLLVGLARAQTGLGKWVVATELYRRILREGVAPGAPQAFVEALKDAQKELDDLEPRVPSVIINVKGPVKSVTLDGAVVPAAALGVKRPADPGTHVIRAEADGQPPVQVTVTLAERKVETATLELKGTALTPGGPPPPSRAGGSPLRTLGIVGIGVGGASLVMGAVTGGLAVSKHSELVKKCLGAQCPPSEYGTLDSFRLMSSLSTAGVVAGGVLAAAGVVLVVTAPKVAPTTTGSVWLSPVLGAGYAGMKGTF
jgi:hypothetical protein